MIPSALNGQGTRCRDDNAGSGGPRLSRLRLSSRFACAVFFARSPALQAPPRRSASRLRTSARAPPAPRCRLSSAAPATARATRLARAPLAPPSRARRCRCEAPQPSRPCRYERATQDRHRGLIAPVVCCAAPLTRVLRCFRPRLRRLLRVPRPVAVCSSCRGPRCGGALRLRYRGRPRASLCCCRLSRRAPAACRVPRRSRPRSRRRAGACLLRGRDAPGHPDALPPGSQRSLRRHRAPQPPAAAARRAACAAQRRAARRPLLRSPRAAASRLRRALAAPPTRFAPAWRALPRLLAAVAHRGALEPKAEALIRS